MHGRLVADVVDAFMDWAKVYKLGRKAKQGQLDNYADKWTMFQNLKRADGKTPWFDGVLVSDIDEKFLIELQNARLKQKTQYKLAPDSDERRTVSLATVKKDMDFVRMVLNHAVNVEKCLPKLPPFPSFEGDFKIPENPQIALSNEEFKKLVAAAKKLADQPTDNARTKRQREELLAFIQLSVTGGLRPSETYSLRWTDIREIKLHGKPAIAMRVGGKVLKWTGKRREGFAKQHGVNAYRRLKKFTPNAKPDDLLFPKRSKQRKDAKPGATREKHEEHKDGVAGLLEQTKLRWAQDDDGKWWERTAKSFRPTGITIWLSQSENPSLYAASIVFRTSEKQIQKYYDQNPALSAAERMGPWHEEPELDVEEPAGGWQVWEQEDEEAPDPVPGELLPGEDDEVDEVAD